MTANQIAYWNLQETQRANRARETETERSNRVNETERERSNRATETNTRYSNYTNRLKQAEDARANLAKETETNRHNLVAEFNDRLKAYANVYDFDSIPAQVVLMGDAIMRGMTEGKFTSLDQGIEFIADEAANNPEVTKRWQDALRDAFVGLFYNIPKALLD